MINTNSSSLQPLKDMGRSIQTLEDSVDQDSNAAAAISPMVSNILQILSQDLSTNSGATLADGMEKISNRIGEPNGPLTKEEQAIIKKIERLLDQGIESADDLKQVMGLFKKLGKHSPHKLRNKIMKAMKHFFKKLADKVQNGQMKPEDATKVLADIKIPITDLMGTLMLQLKSQLEDQLNDLVNTGLQPTSTLSRHKHRIKPSTKIADAA